MIPSEEVEQIALVHYLEARGLQFSAIPHSTYTKSWAVKNRNTRTGVRPGVPDMLVIVPGVGLLFIELKKIKGGVVSEYQKSWIAGLNSCPGVEARVCLGATEAITFIEELAPLSNKLNITLTGDMF